MQVAVELYANCGADNFSTSSNMTRPTPVALPPAVSQPSSHHNWEVEGAIKVIKANNTRGYDEIAPNHAMHKGLRIMLSSDL